MDAIPLNLIPIDAFVQRNKAVVDQFFVALETQNFELLKAIFASGARQINAYIPEGFPLSFDGAEAIYQQYSSLPTNFGAMHFPRTIYATENPEVFFVKFRGEIEIKAGGTYQNDYVGIFKLRNGQIVEYTEYFNPLVMAKAFGIPLSRSNSVKKVAFQGEGSKLIGNVYYPVDYQEGERYPTLIVSGSWTTVKEQMADLYAQKLAEQGFIAFAFDFRDYGESEGYPRYYESPEAKITDLSNALSFLESFPGVLPNSIGLVSICASSGYAARLAPQDRRVRALAMVAAWLHDAESVKAIYGGEAGVWDRIHAAKEAKGKYIQTGQVDCIPAISDTDETAAMFGNYDYYLNPKRGAIPQWSADKFAVMSWEDWLKFDPMPSASYIHTPTLMIHSDGAVLPDNARRFFNSISDDQKELHWTQGTQFDFYDQEKQVNEAVAKITDFCRRHLKEKQVGERAV